MCTKKHNFSHAKLVQGEGIPQSHAQEDSSNSQINNNKLTITNVGKDVEKQEPANTASGNVN
jgi:hypothetical protein